MNIKLLWRPVQVLNTILSEETMFKCRSASVSKWENSSIQYCDPISPPIPDLRGYYDSPPARG